MSSASTVDVGCLNLTWTVAFPLLFFFPFFLKRFAADERAQINVANPFRLGTEFEGDTSVSDRTGNGTGSDRKVQVLHVSDMYLVYK